MTAVGNFEIEAALYDLFTVSDDKFQRVEVGRFTDGLVPGMNVAVLRGRFSTDTIDSYRQEVDIIVLIAVQNINSEYECRKIVHPLVEYVVRKLVGTNLGLDIEDIQPQGWDEKTTIQNHQLGEVVFEVRFKTASSIPSGPITEEDEQFITEILSEYALIQKPRLMQPPVSGQPPQEQPVPPVTSVVLVAEETA